MKAKMVVITVTYDERMRLASDQGWTRSRKYQDDFGDWMALEPGCVANVLAPPVVEFGKPSAIYTL